MTALVFLPVSTDDTSGRVCCEMDGCSNQALQRVCLAGWPAMEVCTTCASLVASVWERETGERVRVRRSVMQRAAA